MRPARYVLLLLNCGSVFAQSYVISTYAGGVAPATPAPGVNSSIGYPAGVATDSAGNLYLVSGLGCLFKLDTKNVMTRVAGTCRPGYMGDGGPALAAEIGVASTAPRLTGIVVDSTGNIYFADGPRIRRVSPGGIISTVAGTGLSGTVGDGGPAVSAQVVYPSGLAVDSAGNLYFTDSQRVRKISVSDGTVNTIAGTGQPGSSGDGGPAASAKLAEPIGLAFDSAGNLYIADSGNYRVRKVSTGGIITTFAGSGTFGSSGDGGQAIGAKLGAVYGLAVDSAGNVYIADEANNRIRKVAPNGIISTVAGSISPGFSGDNGPAASAQLNSPTGLAMDPTGNLYIADFANCRIRGISAQGNIATIAGNGGSYSGDAGPATSAQVYFPQGLAVDATGSVFIADTRNNRVRKISPDGAITTVAGNGIAPPLSESTSASPPPGDGGPATSAELSLPWSVALDSSGDLYIADSSDFRVRKVTPDGVIHTVAGNGSVPSSGDGELATNAGMFPYGVAVDAAGNLYIADKQNHNVREVSPAGVISTIAGTGSPGYSGDGGLATEAKLDAPWALAVDSQGNVYIADTYACAVRKVAVNAIISTYAGNGSCQPAGSGGDGGLAINASLGPTGLAFDSTDNLYITDNLSQRVRMVSAATGVITSIAGQPVFDGYSGNYAGDGGIATYAQFCGPASVAVDSHGDVYVADEVGNAIRKLTPDHPTGLTIDGGDNQTGQSGWTLPYPLQVLVNGSAGVAVPGVSVNFAVTSGTATIAASAVSDSAGMASVQLTVGSNTGSITVTATLAGLEPVQFSATAIATPTGDGTSCTLTAAPVITSVNSATDFGGFQTFAPGSWLEVKGSNLAVDTRLWTGADFQGANAPTSLDGSSVSIDGNAGFVDYISGGQINVQVPADSNTGPVKITVTTCVGTSQPFTGQMAAIEPGLLAPSSFYVPGNPPELVASKQYLVALFQDGATYVGNAGLIPGVPFAPAKPGDTITAYGIGFGSVTPPIPPGVVVSQSNSIPNFSVSFGTTLATVTYAGLAPNAVGLYQFNITVPQVADGDYQISVSVGATPVPQTVYLTVHQ